MGDHNTREKNKKRKAEARKDSKKPEVLAPVDDVTQDMALRDAVSQAVSDVLKKRHNMEHAGAFSLTDPRGMDAGDIWISPFTRAIVEEVFPRRSESHVKFTPLAVSKILNNMANCGVMYQAVMAAGLSYSQFMKIRKDFPALDTLVEDAMDLYREKVAHAVHCRAVSGTEKPVYYKGAVVGYVREYSDRLLELHAKRHCPEYRDKGQLDVNVAGGVLVVHETEQTKEEWLAERRKANAIDGEVVEK